mgnify:FL=1
MSMGLPGAAGDRVWSGGLPDPVAFPELYDGVIWRRVAAYAIDLAILALIGAAVWVALNVVGLLSFGLLMPLVGPAMALVPIAYHGLLVGGASSATIGMRLLGLQVRTVTGAQPSICQAVLMAVLFYTTVGLTGSLILLVSLFNERRRTVHDFLSGMVVVRTTTTPTVRPPY